MYYSYTLIDGVEQNRQNPKTFEIPTPNQKLNLKVGDYVKLGFQCDPEANCPVAAERMWLEIINIDGDDFEGILKNDPYFLNQYANLHCNNNVYFNSCHILAIQ